MADFTFDPQKAKARFHECMREFTALKARAAPLRAKYTALNSRIEKLLGEQKELSEKFMEIESPCAALSNEAAFLARALGGKTGEPEGW